MSRNDHGAEKELLEKIERLKKILEKKEEIFNDMKVKIDNEVLKNYCLKKENRTEQNSITVVIKISVTNASFILK